MPRELRSISNGMDRGQQHAVVMQIEIAMSRIDDLRMMISEIEDELKEVDETDEDETYDVDSAMCKLADLRDELKDLEKSA